MSKFFEKKAQALLKQWDANFDVMDESEFEEMDEADHDAIDHLRLLIADALKDVKQETMRACADSVLAAEQDHGRINRHLAAGSCFDAKLVGEE